MKVFQLTACTLLLIIGQLFLSPAFADDNSEAARNRRVADLKQKIESIQYGAKKPKAVIYVFTDMNCTYCRKLHHEFPKLAEQGVQVRVLAMPRQGLDSKGYKDWVSIWCSSDQNDTLDRAMEGEDIAPKTCKNPIKMHYTLGRKWGVIGTPSVLFVDGTLKAGYFPAEKLAREAIKRSASMDKEDEKDKEQDNSKEKDKDKNKNKITKDINKEQDQNKDKDKDKNKTTQNINTDKDKNIKNPEKPSKEKTGDKEKDKEKEKDKGMKGN